MTKGYWLKIILGALAIFITGMIGVQAVSAAKGRIEHIVSTNSSITLPMLSRPFLLEGRDLGALQSLRIDRSAPKAISGFHLTIDLTDAAALEALASCDLSLADFENIDLASANFACVSPLDMADQEMIPFGTITFQPSGQVHELNLPREVVDDLRHELHGANAEVQDAVAEARAAVAEATAELHSNKIQVRVNGRNVVDLQGGEQGGHLIIRDPATGRTIVEAKGGADGGVLTVDADAVPAPPPVDAASGPGTP